MNHFEISLKGRRNPLCQPGVPIMWNKPLSIIFLYGKHFTLKVSLAAVHSVFGAKHWNLFCFGAMAQLENKLPLGEHRKGAGYIVSS